MDRIRIVSIGLTCAIACALLAGCGDDDGTLSFPTASPTPGTGPVVTFLGVARADDMLIMPSGMTAEGLPIYTRSTGAGFVLVVEGKPGPSGKAVGSSSFQDDLSSFPDLQIEVSRTLGNGSAAVCDISHPLPTPGEVPAGGVPAIDPPTFEVTPTTIDTINDLACRFRDGQGLPMGLNDPSDACLLFPSGDFGFARPDTTMQFCSTVTSVVEFPAGNTVVTVRLRDIDGNTGPSAQMVVRIAP